MRPIDIRNETWKDIQCQLVEDRKRVWEAYDKFGPCTTKELADKSGISLLTLRPRTTELLDMFLVELNGRNKQGGIYKAVPVFMARARFEKAKETLSNSQLSLFGT